jgi:hypothetical protein
MPGWEPECLTASYPTRLGGSPKPVVEREKRLDRGLLFAGEVHGIIE